MPDDDPQRNEYRVLAGDKPPRTVSHEGRRYRPAYIEVTQDSDRRAGQQVFVISAMGEPVEDD